MPLRHANMPSCRELVMQPREGRCEEFLDQEGAEGCADAKRQWRAGRRFPAQRPDSRTRASNPLLSFLRLAALLGTAHTLLSPTVLFLRIALQGSIQTGKVNSPANPTTRPPIAPAPTIMAKISTSTALSFHHLEPSS